LRIGGIVVLDEHVGHRGGELVDAPVGVDVAAGLDRGVTRRGRATDFAGTKATDARGMRRLAERLKILVRG
jgi:hypothetical protein